MAWAKQVGINGTPAYLTNGGVATGVQTLEDLTELAKGSNQ